MFALAASAQAAIIASYSEGFDSGGSTNVSLSYLAPPNRAQGNWNANFSSSATAYSRTSTSSTVSPVVSGAGDFLFINSSLAGASPIFVWTDSLSAGPAYQFDSVQFALGNTDSTTENVRITIQIAGAWYVTNSTYNGGPGPDTFNSRSTAGSTWSVLNFTSGTGMSIGSTTALPTTGTITGVGMYDESRSNTIRFDNLSINIDTDIVPEPSAAMLFGAAGFLILLRRRR